MSKFKINFLFKKLINTNSYRDMHISIKALVLKTLIPVLKESATENCLTFGFNFNIKCI